jgi:hypothetical protein
MSFPYGSPGSNRDKWRSGCRLFIDIYNNRLLPTVKKGWQKKGQAPKLNGALYRFQIKDEIKAARIEATKAYNIVR